jgi:hypothetical protein
VELSLLDAGYGALVLAERPGHLGLSQARSLGGSSQSSAHDPSHANRGLWRALILCMTAVTVELSRFGGRVNAFDSSGRFGRFLIVHR